MAAQCCEHLNRALILEQEGAERFGYEPVNVVPQLKAGGSFATAAYESMRQPTAVEEVRADGGIDIGDTLIGMHLKPVAVPMRILTRKIGGANVVCARVRQSSKRAAAAAEKRKQKSPSHREELFLQCRRWESNPQGISTTRT